jgi:hypothetical protein
LTRSRRVRFGDGDVHDCIVYRLLQDSAPKAFVTIRQNPTFLSFSARASAMP